MISYLNAFGLYTLISAAAIPLILLVARDLRPDWRRVTLEACFFHPHRTLSLYLIGTPGLELHDALLPRRSPLGLSSGSASGQSTQEPIEATTYGRTCCATCRACHRSLNSILVGLDERDLIQCRAL